MSQTSTINQVSEDVDPAVLKGMPYSVDITENNTPLRHKVYCSAPIEVVSVGGYQAIVLTERGVAIHTGGDHKPVWKEPGIHPFDTVRESDVWTGAITFVFD